MEWTTIGLWVAGAIALVLVLQKWFWILVFFFSGLASLFAMLASIAHFQILGALGFFVLGVICITISSLIADTLG